MVAWVYFDSFKTNTINGTGIIDFDTNLIKIALVSNSNPPDINVDDFWDDLSATEMASGNGYTTGGETLGTKTIGEVGGVVTFDAADVMWASNGAGFSTARFAILYYDSTVASTSNLIAHLDFGSDKGNTTGDLTIQMDALGILTLT